MDATISLGGVVIAAASAMVVGSIWYSPSTFLKPWLKITGTSDADMKKNFPTAMGYMVIAALLTAYILDHFIIYSAQATGATGISAGLQVAFWAWLGISLTTVITDGAMESRSRHLMLIQAGNRLVTLLVMGTILGAFL